MPPAATPRRAAAGFTLVEITIVLLVVGLIVIGLIGPIRTQLEARERNQTLATMSFAVEALYGFAVASGRLPCPDTDGDGLENAAPCAAAEGWLPTATLGAPRGDAWGNRLRYRVDTDYTVVDDGICADDGDFDLCEASSLLRVFGRGDNPATPAPATEGKFRYTAGNRLPAVIVSHGRNGFGAISVLGTVRPPPRPGSDEAENSDGDAFYVMRTYSRTATGCADDLTEATPLCEFDDIVMWLSPAVLNNRMVKAGRLP